jgi:hypothetical protein
MGVAAVGAGMYGGGQVTSAVGQNEAMRAMRDAWGDQQGHQAAADAQLRALTQDLLSRVGIQSLEGAQATNEMRAKLDAVARNTTKGAQASLAKRGAKLGAEERARAGRAYDAAGAQSRQLAEFLSQLAGFRGGAQANDMAGRQFASDRSRIVGDARAWQSLAPLQVRAAGMRGGDLRSQGQGMQAVGQGLMYQGMSQPANGEYSNSIMPTDRPQGPAQAPGRR